MSTGKIVLGIVFVVALVFVNAGYFVVTEGQLAIVTQFGRPIGEPITTAGLHFKIPFMHEARFVDKRIMSWDGYPNQIPTKDKKYIKVDTTARWRVVDALKFIQTVRNESGGKARLDAILDSATRDVISNQNLVEAVRNSNKIIEDIEARSKDTTKVDSNLEAEEEFSGEIERVLIGREKLSEQIALAADKELEAFGIKLIDVQLRRISYEKSVESKVYERMISERQRVAQKIRSIGQGEKAKIEGRLARDLEKIESEAYRSAQVVRGKAEAKASAIYAKSLSKDPKFFEFTRTLEAYKKAIGPSTKFILSSDAEFLKFLKKSE
jgi:membrane protease subunit HflC